MSLKEKAKTDDLEIAVQLERILRQHSVEDADAFDRFYERLKIAESKLENSQKEIEELKQKLHQLYDLLKNRPKSWILNSTGLQHDLAKALQEPYEKWFEVFEQKFEELLKKEAKS